MLLLADLLGLSAAFVVAELVLPGSERDRIAPMLEFALFVLLLPGFVVVAKLQGLYDHDEERTNHTTPEDLVGVFSLVTVGAWLFFASTYVFDQGSPSVPRLSVFWAASILFVTLGRAGARALCRRHVSYLQDTVIVGAGDVGQLVARKLIRHPEYGINLVGFVDANPKEQLFDLAGLTILGAPEMLPQIVEALDVERVIVAFSEGPDDGLIEPLRALADLDVQIEIVPRFFDLLGPRADMHTVGGLSLLGLPPFRLSRSSRLLKTGMDVVGASVGLLLLAPLFGLIALLIRWDSHGPIFFRQVRMGVRGRPFRIFKFRTMVAEAEARKASLAHLNMHAANGGDPRMFKIPDDPRVTRVGGFLRRWSLDELPQLFNVLKGDMSLVGPRPLILAEDEYVHDWARKRLDLKPGMTGLWQAVGRSEPFEAMVHLDYRYVTGWSLMNDFKLVLRTIPALFRARRAY